MISLEAWSTFVIALMSTGVLIGWVYTRWRKATKDVATEVAKEEVHKLAARLDKTKDGWQAALILGGFVASLFIGDSVLSYVKKRATSR